MLASLTSVNIRLGMTTFVWASSKASNRYASKPKLEIALEKTSVGDNSVPANEDIQWCKLSLYENLIVDLKKHNRFHPCRS
jgi:hypothetical protein